MMKENMEQIADLSQPFKIMFENSVNETKQEVIDRNDKLKPCKVVSGNFSDSMRKGSQVHFTDSDKRNVLYKFMHNREIMFLLYGIMFPFKTLSHEFDPN